MGRLRRNDNAPLFGAALAALDLTDLQRPITQACPALPKNNTGALPRASSSRIPKIKACKA